jgi:polar amino acid transport system substrate-binding protein
MTNGGIEMRKLAMRLLFGIAGLCFTTAAAQAACEPGKVAEKYPSLASQPVRVATTPLYAPFEYTSPNEDKMIGSDIEVSEAALECVGLKYEYVKGAFTNLLPTVLNGQTDVMVANLFYTEERAKNVDFVVYMKAGSALLVRKGNTHNIKSMDDLCGLTTGAVVGSVSMGILEDQSKTCEAAGKAPISIVAATETDAAVRGIMNDRLDFLLDNAGAAAVRVKDDPANLEIAFTQVRDIKVGNAVKKGNDELLKAYLDGLKEIWKDGTVAKIFTKYGLDANLAIEPEILR